MTGKLHAVDVDVLARRTSTSEIAVLTEANNRFRKEVEQMRGELGV